MVEEALAGRRLVVTGNRPAVVEAIAIAAGRAGARVVALPDTAVSEVERVLAAGESADHVVIVTPPSDPTSFLSMTDDAWSACVRRRVLEPIRVARAAATRMCAAGGGSLVIVGTLDAAHAYSGHADASVAVGALSGLVRSLALELAPDHVRVNLVLAGPIDDGERPTAPPRVERTLLRSPSGRFVRPEEVAAAVLFVAGEDAGFMTGASLRVDAGWAALNQAPDGMRFP